MAECPFPFNVQLFQEMKYRFPDIPVEVIQNCIMKYPRDREACIQLLNKATMNSLDASAWSHLTNNHHYSINVHRKLPVRNGSNPYLENPLFPSPGHYLNLKRPIETKVEMDRPGISGFPSVSQSYPYNVYSVSAVPSEHKPFSLAYIKNVHCEHSQNSQNLALRDAMFLNTRPIGQKCTSNAQLPSVTTSKDEGQITGMASNPLPVSSRENESHHITTLKINPMPPYAYNPSSSICRNVTSAGRHMTSVNLQLQPPSSEPHTPIEITTSPLSCVASQKENSSFNSHVQISISSTGATLTAVRTNKKPPSSSEQQSYVKKSVPSAIIPSKSNPNFSENESGNLQHASGHYNAALQAHSETARFVNVLNMPHSQESLQTKTQHFTSFHSPELDSRSMPTASSELEYTEALLLQQRMRLNFILTVLNQEREVLARIKAEVNSMERDLLQRRLNLTAVSNMTDMQNLREENRQLRVECHCLSMEVDLSLRGQVPLGETDEDFYRNIFTGPVGPIPPAPSLEKEAVDSGDDFTADVEEDIWKCSKCTFANHPALNKCEMCEMERSSSAGHAETGPTYHTQYHRIINAPEARQRTSPERSTRTWPRRGMGHVQIRVTQNRVTVPSKGLDIHLSHRYPRR